MKSWGLFQDIFFVGWALGCLFLLFLITTKTNKVKKSLAVATVTEILVVFAIALIFDVSFVFLAVDQVFGINNISWLISWLAYATSLMFGVRASKILYKHKTYGLGRFIIVCKGAILGVYVSTIQYTDSYPLHLYARSKADILFLWLLYIPAMITMIHFSIGAVYASRQQVQAMAKARVKATSYLSIILFFVFLCRIVISLKFYTILDSDFVEQIFTISMIGLIIVSILMTIPSLFPTKLIHQLRLNFQTIREIKRLENLIQLQKKIRAVYDPVVYFPQPSLWEFFQNRSLQEYKILIEIMDAKARWRLGPPNDKGELEQYAPLMKLLMSIDDNQSFEDLVFAYSNLKIGRRNNVKY